MRSNNIPRLFPNKWKQPDFKKSIVYYVCCYLTILYLEWFCSGFSTFYLCIFVFLFILLLFAIHLFSPVSVFFCSFLLSMFISGVPCFTLKPCFPSCFYPSLICLLCQTDYLVMITAWLTLKFVFQEKSLSWIELLWLCGLHLCPKSVSIVSCTSWQKGWSQ